MSEPRPNLFDAIAGPTTSSLDPLEASLARQPVLRDLPPFLRDPIKDAIRSLDESLVGQAIDTLRVDDDQKAAIHAAAIALLKLLKGETAERPIPPLHEMPASIAPPNPVAPGEMILSLPVIKF